MDTNTQNIKSEVNKNIFELFDIAKLPEEKQEETIGRIGKIIFQSVLMRVLPILSDEDIKEYEEKVESNPEPEALLDFLFLKVPDLLEIIKEESENFRNESKEILEGI